MNTAAQALFETPDMTGITKAEAVATAAAAFAQNQVAKTLEDTGITNGTNALEQFANATNNIQKAFSQYATPQTSLADNISTLEQRNSSDNTSTYEQIKTAVAQLNQGNSNNSNNINQEVAQNNTQTFGSLVAGNSQNDLFGFQNGDAEDVA